MYAVKSGGATVGYADSIVWIRLHANGCYVQCRQSEAEGFCVKTAVNYTEEETDDVTTRLEDRVYKLKAGGLSGIEPIGEVEAVSGALILKQSDEILDILLGGRPV